MRQCIGRCCSRLQAQSDSEKVRRSRVCRRACVRWESVKFEVGSMPGLRAQGPGGKKKKTRTREGAGQRNVRRALRRSCLCFDHPERHTRDEKFTPRRRAKARVFRQISRGDRPGQKQKKGRKTLDIL